MKLKRLQCKELTQWDLEFQKNGKMKYIKINLQKLTYKNKLIKTKYTKPY